MAHFRHAWALLFAVSLMVMFVEAIPLIVLGQPPEPVGARNLEEITRLSAPLGFWVKGVVRILGLSALAFAVFGAAISAKAYRKGEMWAWYASWVVPVPNLGATIINFTFGGTIWPLFLAWFVVSLVGLLAAPQFESIIRREKKAS